MPYTIWREKNGFATTDNPAEAKEFDSELAEEICKELGGVEVHHAHGRPGKMVIVMHKQATWVNGIKGTRNVYVRNLAD